MLANGYIPYHPAIDVGIDAIYYLESRNELLRVQLKSRPTIDKKYLDRQIWIAFPDGGDWFLFQHDDLVSHVKGLGVALPSDSWQNYGRYSWSAIPAWMRQWLERFKVEELTR